MRFDGEHRVDHFNYREDGDLGRHERSPTPILDESDSKSKLRKRLVKKDRVKVTNHNLNPNHGITNDFEDVGDFVREDSRLSSDGRKRKKFENDYGSDKGVLKFKVRKTGECHRELDGDSKVKEMWQTIVGGDSEVLLMVNSRAEEGNEKDDEISQLFKAGKKKKKHVKSAAEISMLIENVMAELEVVAEEDVELNRQSKPAINKLRKLSFLQEVLSKKQFQVEFLDHGVLALLKTWLEPLPDGSLPNINIREAVLKLLHDFPIDLEQFDRREQLKKSGLGKVIMFFSKLDEETTSNKRLAKELVDKWSRPIFNKSTRFEDMRGYEDERVPLRRPSAKTLMHKDGLGMQSRDDDLDLGEVQGKDLERSSSGRLTTRPEAMSMDFIVRPMSKIDPDTVRARVKQVVQDQCRLRVQKKLQQLKATKKKQIQAIKLSVEGRGIVKYL